MINTQETIDLITKIKKNINIYLSRNDLQPYYLQEVVEYLVRKEYEVLKNYQSIKVYQRKIIFKGYNRAYRSYAKCKIINNDETAEISLAKSMLVPNNAEAIVETLAHEALHAILPWEEAHGTIFKLAMIKLNDKLKLNINITDNYPQAEIEPKYELYCPKCGTVYLKRYRKTGPLKEPGKYNCFRCKSPLALKTMW